jgi:hypothetical protein
VVDRSAAGKPAGHPDPLLLHEFPVHLFSGILVLPDDDGVVVLPEQKIALALVHLLEDVFLEGQVVVWVCAGGFDIDHPACSFSSLRCVCVHSITNARGREYSLPFCDKMQKKRRWHRWKKRFFPLSKR